ncbi:hypothetical protein BS47DRAFT_1369276 [Hydnum rufescens UP504]|uniref:Uncharacterized protein n=1 Tax=Hydnum rufescens UP504 TaxID=1448309 RepID=A0A9P6DFU5_9AGAM|nr:hypothetical protein BS47DRAFT_1369276 [Hydnum rufescens UP504]
MPTSKSNAIVTKIGGRALKAKPELETPEIFSPRMVELSQVELDMMEARVNELRPTTKTCVNLGRKRKATEMTEDDRAVPGEDDAVEPGMNVPNSVLDMCGDSFIAADGDHIKASTQQFDDTGLMALLCRHDIALYVANMRTAGEKQFYAFALVAALSRSCRMVDCGDILWYHPQKSEIWGLSDGEGCERFWSELQRLIPSLRVTGYHRQLFIIDLQVEHIDELKQQGLAKWLHDRTLSAHKREGEAMARLGGQSILYLLDQFKSQRAFQSKTDALPTAQSLWIHLKETVDELGELATDSSTVVVEDELWAKIEAMRSSIKRIESNIKKKTEELHLSDRMSHKELDRLKTDKWVNLQLNICVVRDQILIKLRVRKFELAGLDCADTGRELDHRMKEHVEKAMKSRVSGVQGALKRYEEIRREMMKLRGKGSVAADAISPQRYPHAEVKFFALLELHHLHDLVEAWQRHSSAMLGSDGQIGWMNLPEQPPPLCYGRIQILCGPVSPVANSLTGEAVDGVSDAASSDDDENGELEDAPVPQDIAFLAALDALEELVGDDA